MSSQFHGNWPPEVPTAPAHFDKDERITKVRIFRRDYTWARNETPHGIAGMQVHTNKGFYNFRDTGSHTDECSPLAGEQVIGFYGHAGSYLDRLGCLFGKVQE